MSLDWSQIALNLRAKGVSAKYIMRETGISDKTLGNWRNGRVGEPTFSRGLALLKLHRKFCEQEHMRDVYEKA